MGSYIKTLQSIGAMASQRLIDKEAKLMDFRAHLLSQKFSGIDTDGDRKDWIATADVLRWIEDIRAI